jgi:hydroxylamine reductase
MFCYQCQEAAGCKGCTIKGVCGKTEDVAKSQDLLIYVVKGLAVVNNEGRKVGVTSKKADKLIVYLQQ